MYTPDKIAALFLKFFVTMFLLSLITSLTNVVPYYIQLNHAANDLLLRGAVNNYILQSQVDETVKKTFVENELFKSLTYTREGSSTGIHVYAKTSPTAGNLFPKVSGCNVGEACPAYKTKSTDKQVIIAEGGSFDPKTNTNDMIKFRQTYLGAQRGDTISVRVDAKVNCVVLLIGKQLQFRIPLSVIKSGPAMHYFRI